MKKDFLSIADCSGKELLGLIELSAKVKKNPGGSSGALRGKSLALIFEKQSLRTHVTFDVGVYQLGAHPVYLTQADISLGTRETVYDTGRNLERWVDGVVVRTFAHKTCVELAESMSIPVINALTDHEHPCQAVGDFLTIKERTGGFKGKKLVWVGDGNNVCHSLMLLASKLGMSFTAATPPGYEPDGKVLSAARAAGKKSGSLVEVTNDPRGAMKDADAVYTDVWVSMGQEKDKEKKTEAFRRFQINAKMMSYAKNKALFMHCLPAHRGQEVTDSVMDSKNSVVFDQAENRLHSAKAVMITLMHERAN